MLTLPPHTEMWRAVRERDGSYRGVFFFGVKTTGVFCVPGCRARRPRPENVQFFASADEARAAGFRDCRICSPATLDAGPAWFLDLIAELERHPTGRWSDADLAGRGWHPATVRRWSKRLFGVTFHALRRGFALGRSARVSGTGAAADVAGYESESGFRAAFSRWFEQAPGTRVDRTAGFLTTPLGPMVAVATDRGLCRLEFVERPTVGAAPACVLGDHPHIDAARIQLAEYFAGTRRTFDLEFDPDGTPFQRSVWSALREIPYGETRSYRALAAAAGRPASARAAGRANATNPLWIVFPCHRVIRADGTLSGYAGGVWRKQRLLELEREFYA